VKQFMLYIILPIYNEEKSIAVLLKKINKILKAANEPFQIIGLDDGSHDQTAEILNDLQDKIPLKIIAHKINRGLGETARDLFEYAASISQPNDIIIRMDADNTHEPKYISPMISKIKHGYDVVIASRFKKGGGMIGVSKYRSIVSYGANLLMKIFFPIKGVQEYSCGFRAYRASTIKTAIKIFGNDFISLKGMGFTGTVEKLIKLQKTKARITEIPFQLRYDQKNGPSKMVTSLTTIGYLILILKNIYPWGKQAKIWHKRIQNLTF